ncbi:serine/threonine-protein kinase sid1-like [Dorcoceras hygrometricum]|uniref:Serine/threonine-protein kinase sid1-like n=1 Tax=Dorcoceras hygrometricum TaxID=472368 RepID=A0A2Z7A7V5_9LAMI|nr:serine/threonine-protein kinase sid1-like [Dorcoceras hygrometricum]
MMKISSRAVANERREDRFERLEEATSSNKISSVQTRMMNKLDKFTTSYKIEHKQLNEERAEKREVKTVLCEPKCKHQKNAQH